MKFIYFDLTDIESTDILNNVSPECKAILLDDQEGIYWIELTDNGFFVPDGNLGNSGFRTNRFTLAVNYLTSFIIDNQ